MTFRTVISFVGREGAYWLQWPKELQKYKLADDILEAMVEENNKNSDYAERASVTLFGLEVHALKFEGDIIWDCINGFRLTNNWLDYAETVEALEEDCECSQEYA